MSIVPTPSEVALQYSFQSVQEWQRAEQKSLRAEEEYQRAERLAEKLRSLGIDPEV